MVVVWGVWLVVVGWGLVLGRGAGAEVAGRPAEQAHNLLANPGFEGNYSAWSGIGPIQVADGWTPWWVEDPDADPQLFRPEWKPAEGAYFPYRVRSGARAQQYFTFFASHVAGMYQQVFNVTPGQTYRFTIWAQVWSSTEDNPPTVSFNPANPHLKIGIDPTGNWNPFSGNVVWSPEASMTSILDKYGEVSVEATAQNSVITVFMRTNPDFAVKHNDTYWDDASLVLVGPPPPPTQPPTNTPAPTNTVGPATQTAQALATDTPLPSPAASNTPELTDTPAASPTASPTRAPTNTPLPTATLVPSATDTPAATDTPEATETAAGTEVAAAPTTAPSTTPAAAEVEPDTGTGLPGLTVLLAVGGFVLVVLGLVAAAFLLRRRG